MKYIIKIITPNAKIEQYITPLLAGVHFSVPYFRLQENNLVH